jgi:3-oxoacyl-[acyl-carrier protein] reductase
MGDLLKGHRAAVTGGASGIGAAIAAGYAREGAEVIILDHNTAAADITAEGIQATGGKAHVMALDVTDKAACDATAAKIASDIGEISILVNNAGINRRNPMTGDKAAVVKDWDDIVDVNIKGVFNVTHAFLDQLRNNKGRVVNIGRTRPPTPPRSTASSASRRRWPLNSVPTACASTRSAPA